MSWFASKSTDFYEDGIKSLSHRYEKCMAMGGKYAEKGELEDWISDRNNIWMMIRVKTYWPLLVEDHSYIQYFSNKKYVKMKERDWDLPDYCL